jgi:hypothetical protein
VAALASNGTPQQVSLGAGRLDQSVFWKSTRSDRQGLHHIAWRQPLVAAPPPVKPVEQSLNPLHITIFQEILHEFK